MLCSDCLQNSYTELCSVEFLNFGAIFTSETGDGKGKDWIRRIYSVAGFRPNFLALTFETHMFS